MARFELRCAIEALRYRYPHLSKKKRGQILTELESRFDVDRKYLVRLLAPKRVGRPRNPGQRGRPSPYGDPSFERALRKVWSTTGYLCGRYLESAIPDWLPFIEQDEGEFAPDIRERLLRISASTIDRHLRPFKAEHGKTLTRSGGLIRTEIPIQGNEWNISVPGFIECDTAAHCGSSMFGEFISSLTVVDIASAWTEVRGVWGRGSSGVVDMLKDIERSVPFTLLGYDSDNGGEVLNWHVINYFTDRQVPVQVTRSRAYCKNDNAHVEQRNNGVARKYLGYERLDFHELLPLVNRYYREVVCPLINHYMPTHKLKDKLLLGAKRRRIYDRPVTPYARVMASEHVAQPVKERLAAQHKLLNPVTLMKAEKALRKEIDVALRELRKGRDIVSKNLNFQHSKSRILSA